MSNADTRQKRKACAKPVRVLLWNKYIGRTYGVGRCYCCRYTEITPFDFEAGHVVAHANGGPDTAENLRPICVHCNKSMGVMNMYDYQKKIGREPGFLFKIYDFALSFL